MLSVAYDEIFSRFLSQVEAYDLVMDDEDVAKEKLNEWLRSIKSNPRVRKSFATLSLDNLENNINFDLKIPEDDDSDIDFVTEIFALGISWKWATAKYLSAKNTEQYFGSGDRKFFAQSNHMDKLHDMYKETRSAMFGMLRDRNTYKNTYLEES